ncbi:hypothetical protein E5161_07225 [Cohnella pontilimi]|uniref:DUF5050 domain-containing protein n=1 Tax=Cohnella pontilimi TaxID=2564100 RepID=A0A4U0FD22_9BACL|nr:hypothetical protein [Cohnella pontilimi]TJY42637.1 hypothetical protein E5161_07225 [Cohnella pontilimi]
MKKKAAALLSTLMLVALIIPQTIFASPSEVKVTLPSFNIYLNGIKIENAYRQYPLIVYNDMTYFPATYYDTRFLGVEATWDPTKGLEIKKTGVTAAYRDFRGSAKNKKTQTGTLRTTDFKLNGRVIPHTDQGQFPLLSFRNVTYFPLTWNYAVKELGWTYKFDSKSGLSIVSTNPQVTKATALPGRTADGAIVYKGNKYTLGADGKVLKTPIGKTGKSEVIYQLPFWSEGDGKTRVHGELCVEDGDLWLFYHQGGAVMGHDEYWRLNSRGKFEEVESGYMEFRTFGDTKIKVNLGVPPYPNNLSVQIGNQNPTPAGDPAYLYGWVWEVHPNGTAGGGGSGNLHLINHDLYVIAFNTAKDTDFSRLYKVNLETNETTRVSDLKATNFAIVGKTVYLNNDGDLYRLPIEGGPEERLNPGSKLASLTEDNGYALCIFVKEANTPYTLIVYDLNGEAIFKTSDVVSSAAVENGKLFYIEEASKNVYTTSLKLKTK